MVRAFGFFASILLLAGPASAIPSDDRAKLAEYQAIQEALDQNWAELMKPGPKQVGWDKGGVDIYKLLDAAPGGAKRNVFLMVSNDGQRAVDIVDAGAIGNYLPKSWRTVSRGGSAQYAPGQYSLTFSKFDGRYFTAGWEKRRRVGGAFCADGDLGVVLYDNPELPDEGQVPPAFVATYFDDWNKRMEKVAMCARYDPVAGSPNHYRVTYFLEDGRTLPSFNALEDTLTIVPAAPVEELLSEPKSQRH